LKILPQAIKTKTEDAINGKVMSRKPISVILFTLVLIGLLNSAFKIQPFEVAVCSGYEANLEKAALFLNSTQFDPTVGLCREAPNVAPNTYWLVSDNLLAYHALKYYYPETAEVIYATMLGYGYFRSFKHEVVFGTTIPYIPFRTPNTYVVAQNATKLIKTDVCNGSGIFFDYLEYADLCIFAALHFYWSGNIPEAINHFDIAKNMWNGTGVYDKASKAAENEGERLIFSTYKLSLLLYCSRILGQPLENRTSIEETLWLMQDEQYGGLHTDYNINLNYTGSDMNTETTSLAILAYKYEPKIVNRPVQYPPSLNIPPDYQKIQQAINHANSGDTIFIRNGTYFENVVVNKTVSLIGESKNSTIIDGNTTGTVIVVSSDDSRVSNLTIRNSGESGSYGMSGARYGIFLTKVSKCNLTDNIITNNSLGIFFESSSYNTLRNNNITMNQYNFGVLGSELSHYIQDVDNSNLVDGKPVYYWVNHNGEEIPSGAGFVAIVNSTNIIAKNLDLENNYEGVLFAYAWNSTVTNNTAVSNLHGIVTFSSSNVTISDNNVTGEPYYGLGIGLILSSNNTVLGNTVTRSMYGISLGYLSSNNIVIENMIANNSEDGIQLTGSSDNLVLNNTIQNNGNGIDFSFSGDHNRVTNNTITYNDCGININANDNTFSGNMIANNKKFGVSLILSSNNTFSSNQIINGNSYGVALYQSSDYNTFCKNDIVNNTMWGVSLTGSDNNMFCGNNIERSEYSVYLRGSSNKFYHNNFISNVHSAMTFGLSNIWDDGYPSGGNYWSDYNGTDSDYDCIGNTPYFIDANNQDNYPLMGMFSSFNTSYGYAVDFISNSSISNISFNLSPIEVYPPEAILAFNVSGKIDTDGFLRVCIPKILINGSYVIMFDDQIITNTTYPQVRELPCLDETYTCFYINYTHCEHTIEISGITAIPEFPSFLILPLFMIVTLLAVIVYRRKHTITA
jgi:parallel beta-helix repeat protein